MIIDKTTPVIYYGSFRPNRVKYFKKYFDKDIVVSSTPKNHEKFRDIGIKARFIGKLNWNDTRKNLGAFSASLYIEDEHTHKNFNFLAGRFYEAINANIPMFFDISCRRTVRLAGYYHDIGDWFFVRDKEELHKKVRKIKETGFNWPGVVIDKARKEKIKSLINMLDTGLYNKRILIIDSHAALIKDKMGAGLHARNALEMTRYFKQVLGDDNVRLTSGMLPWKHVPEGFEYFDVIIFNYSSYYQFFQELVGHIGGWGGKYYYVINEYNLADHPALRELYKIYKAKFSVIASFGKESYNMKRDYFWNAVDDWHTINLNPLILDYDIEVSPIKSEFKNQKEQRKVFDSNEARNSKRKIDIIMKKQLRLARGRVSGILV